MISAPPSEAAVPRENWRARLRLCFVGVHLVGLLSAVLGYRLLLHPAERALGDRQVNVIAAGVRMQVDYGIWDSAERDGQKEFARNFAANRFADGMKDLSPALAAYFKTATDYRVAGNSFSVLYTIGAVIAFFGLIGYLVLSFKGTWLKCAAILATVGLFWGGAAGLLFDCFPFPTFLDHHTEPWGAIVGGACAAMIGFVAGLLTLAVAGRGEKKREANEVLQSTGSA